MREHVITHDKICLLSVRLQFFLSTLGVINIPYLGLAAFILGSIALGIFMSKVIEIPVIRLRDRFLPSDVAPDLRAIGTADIAPALEPASSRIT